MLNMLAFAFNKGAWQRLSLWLAPHRIANLNRIHLLNKISRFWAWLSFSSWQKKAQQRQTLFQRRFCSIFSLW